MRAILSADGTRFRLKGPTWEGVYAVAELPAQIAFYGGLMKRRPASAPFYAPTLAALEKLRNRLGRPVE